MKIELRGASDSDRPALVHLLDAASLPVADLAHVDLARFVIAESGGELLGCVGAEVFDDTALLRSLVVADAARGAGIGKRLLAELEGRLRAARIPETWLLTIDADGFFARQGFRVRPRDAAPPEIRGTREFSALCPGDALLMSKSIG